MRKVMILVLGILLTTAAVWVMSVKSGECRWCYSGQCLNGSICGSGCVCIKDSGDVWGYCASIN